MRVVGTSPVLDRRGVLLQVENLVPDPTVYGEGKTKNLTWW